MIPSRSAALCGALVLAACAPRATVNETSAAPFDLVIANGKVVDGSGNAWFYGDVGIRGNRIVRVAPAGFLRGSQAARRIDASGLVVAPGFIDIQSHSRGDLLFGDGRVVSKVTQGITTEIMGEGESYAPLTKAMVAQLSAAESDARARSVLERFQGPRGFDSWLRAMQEHGGSTNFGSFLGAATVRVYAKGEAQGAPSAAELDTMRTIVRNAMEDGAFGVASALIYPPGNFATTEELVEIAKAMSPYNGVYITHMRSEADDFLEAIDEALRIGREGRVPVEIYHLKAAGKRNWSKAPLAIAKIDSARAAGQDIGADMYAYVAGGTGLAACLPPWASADGKLLENLRNPATRAKIKAEVLTERTTWENLCQLSTPEGVMVVEFKKPANKKFEGMRVAEIAKARNEDWVDAVINLTLEEDARLGGLFFMAAEENLALQMRQPWIKFGTDAGGSDPDSATSIVHPRTYGNFARILGKYVREEKVMPLEEAIRKMTSAVANRLSIRDRGMLREGMFADVVVFDPNTVGDRATYQQPHQLSVGMQHVLVNGVEVVTNGKHTGAKPGMIVRGPGYSGHR